MRRWAIGALCLCLGAPLVGLGPAADEAATRAQRQAIFDRFEADDAAGAVALIEAYIQLRPDDGAMLYNAACAHSRLGDLPRAESLLMASLRAGFLNFAQMQRDPDLEPLRNRGVYKAILAARRAADAMLAQRQIEHWTRQFPEADYRYDIDQALRLSFATSLDEAAHGRLRRQVSRLAEHLVASLFESPLEHYVMIAVPTNADARSLFSDAHVHGSYRHRRRELITTDVDRSLRHELVHAYHHHHMDTRGQEHPVWIQEGIASLYEACRIDGDGHLHVRPNDRDVLMRTIIERNGSVPWPTLFAMTNRDFLGDPATHYAQVRSMLSFVAHHGRLTDWYGTYVDAYEEDRSGAAALEAVFGRTVAELERDWRNWALRQASEAIPDAADPAFVVDGEVFEAIIDPAAEAERQWIAEQFDRGRSLYRAGRFHDAIEVLTVVTERDSEHADAHYTLGLAYVRLDDLNSARRMYELLSDLDASLTSLLGNLMIE